MEPKGESKYERLRKIGIGSYGVVFKCVNRQTGQIVAIKRYSENDSDPIIRKIAMREVRMLRQLKHPNLIHLIEVFRRKRRLHLVFDYCELTVLDVIEKYANKCPYNLIRKISWQLVNGINYCHSHNCIHRDIKPENILINNAGIVKICDFGFARTINGGSSSKTILKSQSTVGARQLQLEREAHLLGLPSNQVAQWSKEELSKDKENEFNNNIDNSSNNNNNNNNNNNSGANTIARQALTEYVATRWYRAPELLVGEVYYDTKIDIWAIGCVTAELMRGEPLWPGKTDLDQLMMIKSSLGSLTSSQAHNLLTQNLYDQINIERVLNQPNGSMADSLERRLPAHYGRGATDFVLYCLRMDPNCRPSCRQLMQHSYIKSARMAKWLNGSSSQKEQAPNQTSSMASTFTGGVPSASTNEYPHQHGAQQMNYTSTRMISRMENNTSNNNSSNSSSTSNETSTTSTTTTGRMLRDSSNHDNTTTMPSIGELQPRATTNKQPSSMGAQLNNSHRAMASNVQRLPVANSAGERRVDDKRGTFRRSSNEQPSQLHKRKLPPLAGASPIQEIIDAPTGRNLTSKIPKQFQDRRKSSESIQQTMNDFSHLEQSPPRASNARAATRTNQFMTKSSASVHSSPYKRISQSNGNLNSSGVSNIPQSIAGSSTRISGARQSQIVGNNNNKLQNDTQRTTPLVKKSPQQTATYRTPRQPTIMGGKLVVSSTNSTTSTTKTSSTSSSYLPSVARL